LFILMHTSMYAQSTVVASGGVTTGNGSSVSYSLGQLVSDNYTGSNGSLTIGIQQSFEIQVVNGVEDTRFQLLVKAYPNPTTDELTLTADNVDLSHSTIELYDMEGRILLQKAITTKEVTLNMRDFVPAAYILRILDKQKEIKSFKIIKN
jgi:hypothetical protein